MCSFRVTVVGSGSKAYTETAVNQFGESGWATKHKLVSLVKYYKAVWLWYKVKASLVFYYSTFNFEQLPIYLKVLLVSLH